MVCIYCGSETKVANSRPQKKINHIWRRRECSACKAIFTTSEAPDLFKSLLVKKGKHLEPFSRDKLFLALYDSVKHRKTATTDATGLTDTVIAQLYPHVKFSCIDRREIVKTAVVILKHFDKAAASHYEAFHSLSS